MEGVLEVNKIENFIVWSVQWDCRPVLPTRELRSPWQYQGQCRSYEQACGGSVVAAGGRGQGLLLALPLAMPATHLGRHPFPGPRPPRLNHGLPELPFGIIRTCASTGPQ